MSIALPKPVQRWITQVSLRWVLTLPFVVLTVAAVVMVGYLSYQSGQQAVTDLGHQLVASTNERVIQELKVQLEKPILINRLNADAVKQGHLDLQNIPALEATLLSRLQQFDRVSALLFVNPQGLFRLVERYPPLFLGVANPPQPDEILIYELDDWGRREKLIHVDQGLDVRRDRPFYAMAVKTGKPGWSPISQYGHNNELTLDAFHPVYDHITKQLLGVFAVHLRLSHLNEFLRSLDISRFGRIMVMEPDGDIVAASTGDGPKPPQPHFPPDPQITKPNIYQSQDELMRSLGNYLRDHPTLQSLNQSQLLEFSHQGKAHYVKITPFQAKGGLNWQILTVIPKSYFMGAIQDNVRTTAWLSLGALGVALALGLLANELLLTRFRQLDQVSQQLATGNLNQRLLTDRPIAEFNSLARSFNQMADQLQQSFDGIKAALETSETKFLTIFRTSPDPMVIANLAAGQILETNDSLLTFFGYSRTEVIGRTSLELKLWHNLDQRAHFRSLLQQEGHVQNLEVQLCKKTGEVGTVLLSAEVRTLEGQACVILMLRDVSDRKLSELALQQSEARYRAIIEDQTELICRSWPDTTVLFANNAYCRYFGVQLEELIGKPFLPYIYAKEQEDIAHLIQALSCTNPTLIKENRVVVNGEVRWMQWIDRALFDDQGNVIEIQSVGRDITDLKQIEAALRRSEANLLQAQQIAHLGSWEVDLTTQENTWSAELFRILELDPTQSEPSFATLIKVIPVEDRSAVVAAMQGMITDGTPYAIEHRIQRLDGSMHYVISKGEAILQNQQVVKLYGTVLDITDLRQVEAALQESEARFRQLAETVREGFFIFETSTSQYSYLNSACISISGIPTTPSQEDQDFSRGMTHWLSNIHPDDRNRIETALQRERQGEDFNEEYRFLRPDGELRWLRSQAFPIKDTAGTVVRIVGTVEDITDRKQMEAALRDSEERFRRAFDDAPIGISLISPTGHFLKANAYYCNLLGYTEADLLGLTFQDITHPLDLEVDLAGLQQMLVGETSGFQMEKRYISKQGAIISALMKTAPIRDQNGRILYFVGHIQDIRDRLKVERMKDEFISVISHELRTPLTSIRGALGILGTGVYSNRPEKAQHMLEIAINNSDRLVRLVNDILDLERLQSGKAELIMQPCQVEELLQQAVDSVQAIADQLTIALSVKSVFATLYAAPDTIVQTLTNLLSNAIKFSSPGDTVWLKAELPLPPSPYILFSITDQGRGIPADKLDMIFEQFQQVDASDSRKKGGTGLGLAICKNIVQQHGGEIWAESQIGQGSTFYFTLPLRRNLE